MSFIWHGFNLDKKTREKQCYYEFHCLTCFLKTAYIVAKLGFKHRRKKNNIKRRERHEMTV